MNRTLLWSLQLLLVLGCARSQTDQRRPREIETVDVGSGYDAELTTEEDERARHVELDMGGVLPSDFPGDLPVFTPSSIVDFGPGFVEVDTPVPESEVRSSIGPQLERSGWTVAASDTDAMTFRRSGRSVQIHLSPIGSGTRIRYVY